jgi:hypothetical protein
VELKMPPVRADSDEWSQRFEKELTTFLDKLDRRPSVEISQKDTGSRGEYFPYDGNRVVLYPGATEKTLTHELTHAADTQLGEVQFQETQKKRTTGAALGMEGFVPNQQFLDAYDKTFPESRKYAPVLGYGGEPNHVLRNENIARSGANQRIQAQSGHERATTATELAILMDLATRKVNKK